MSMSMTMITLTPEQLTMTVAVWSMYLSDALSEREMMLFFDRDPDCEEDVRIVMTLKRLILQCQENIEAQLQSTGN